MADPCVAERCMLTPGSVSGMRAPAHPRRDSYCASARNPCFSGAAALKSCSSRSSKARFVWVGPRAKTAAAAGMAAPGALESVLSQGRTSVVMSEAMDGGCIRLAVAVPFAGAVIGKLRLPMLPHQFLYACLRAAPATATPALASLLALGGRDHSPRENACHRLGRTTNRAASGMISAQCAVVDAVLASPGPVQVIWSIAGAGKSGIMVQLWTRDAVRRPRGWSG